MTALRWAAAVNGGLLVAGFVMIVWGLPVIYGPPSVTCHDTSPADCERTWRAAAAEDGGLMQLLPVTKVTIWGHGACDDGEIWRVGGFGRVWSELC